MGQPAPALERPAQPLPLGAAGRLGLLAAQLRRGGQLLAERQAATAAAMTDEELDDAARHAALRALRATAWRLTRELLPLVHRVPPGYRTHPGYTDCLRAYHEVRRACEDARRDHANWRADLVAGT